MGFWFFMLAMVLLTPVFMIVLGLKFMKKPPAEINGLFGYRSTRSMKSEEAWRFAHALCGKLWYRIGFALVPLSLAAMLLAYGAPEKNVAIAGSAALIAQMIAMTGSILPVERALKKNFDSRGRRK